jgi:hypothetical protein
MAPAVPAPRLGSPLVDPPAPARAVPSLRTAPPHAVNHAQRERRAQASFERRQAKGNCPHAHALVPQLQVARCTLLGLLRRHSPICFPEPGSINRILRKRTESSPLETRCRKQSPTICPVLTARAPWSRCLTLLQSARRQGQSRIRPLIQATTEGRFRQPGHSSTRRKWAGAFRPL